MADKTFTEADVQLLLDAMDPAGIYLGMRDFALAALAALDEAGRLLPPGVEITEKFGVMGEEPRGQHRRPYVMTKGTREAAEEYITEQREDWPNDNLRLASHWASEWVEVPADA